MQNKQARNASYGKQEQRYVEECQQALSAYSIPSYCGAFKRLLLIDTDKM